MAESPAGGIGQLKNTRLFTWLSIALERAWPLLLPVLAIAALFVAVSWFGLFRLMPDGARLAVVGLFAAAGLAALFPLGFFRLPSKGEIDRRIERANALEHRPVSTQSDRLAGGADTFSRALWLEHQRRMAARLGDLASDLPRTGVPERDPWGLRAIVVLLLVTAFAFSHGPLGGRVDDAFRAHGGREVVPPRIDAWVTPPAYTGRPPVFMTAEANRGRDDFDVPEGSVVTLRVTGGSGTESLSYEDAGGGSIGIADAAAGGVAGGDRTGAAASRGARQFSHTLKREGVLRLADGDAELGRWHFAVRPDRPPRVTFTEELKRAVNGTLELAYRVDDDHGAASGGADIRQRQAQAPDARPLYEAPEVPLSLPRRGAREPDARTARDLTEHPWAGTDVTLQLSVVDDAGQEGRSETRTLKLPERPFGNPLSRALVEQRRVLALDANRKQRVLELMDAITLRPDDTFDNMSHYLAIMSARSRLRMASSDEALRGVVDYLWEIAIGIEDGALSAAEKRLQAAQEALRQALEDGASDEEIERLMDELRQAMQEFLREFAERAARDPNMAQQMPMDGQEMRQSDLERMLDQIEELAKSGARDQAQELLSQLQQMMNNLQMARRQPGQQGQQGEMRQQMDRLGDIMRRQQEMMNETHRLDQMQRGQRQRGQNRGEQRGDEGQSGEPGQRGMTPEEFAEALRQLQEGQNELRGELGELMEGLEGMGIEPGEGFGEAGEAMGEAGEALGEGQGERAVGEQGRALEALRRGAQDMMQQMQQAMQGDQGDGEFGGREQNADRDPLGRPRATTGPDFGDTVKVPDEIDVQRARRILEAIRRRLGDALSPDLERDYLERLLDMQ